MGKKKKILADFTYSFLFSKRKRKQYKIFLSIFFLFFLISFLSSLNFVSGVTEQSENYVKLFLNPFYVTQLDKNINYTFNLDLSVPDKIGSVTTALITFQTYSTLNGQDFYLYVNGEPCNNPSYRATEKGLTFAIFECSNIITKEGNYDITIYSDKDGGSLLGWLDLTYRNNPKGELSVSGTEYSAGQDGKVFLQLLDSNSLPIENSTCFASIYYPDASIWKYQQLMSYVGEGIYAYDFITPLIQGVYPVSAFCTLPSIDFGYTKEVSDYLDTGTISGGFNWDNNWTLDGCSIQNTYFQTSAYSIECDNNRNPNRNFTSTANFSRVDYDFWFRATSLEANEFVYVQLIDASGNPFTMATMSEDNDDGSWRRVTGSFSEITDSFDFNGTITFQLVTNGNLEPSDYYFIDTINISLSSEVSANATEYQIIRGSSELHITSDKEYSAEIDYGELTNETFDGYFYLYYDVYSGTNVNKTGINIQLPVFNAFPCDEVKEVYHKNQTGDWESISFTKQLLGNRNDRCAVNLELDLNVGGVEEVYIKMTNYWRLELLGLHQETTIDRKIINDGCEFYRQSQGYDNFSIPLNSSPTETDEFWLSCQYYFQAYYDFNKTLAESFVLNVENANYTEKEMGEIEGIYLNLLQESLLLEKLASGILNVWQQGNDYSQTILSGGSFIEYLTFFANISGNQQNYNEIMNLNVSINNSEIANAVWNYNNTINPSILSQIGGGVYSVFNSTYNFIAQITDSIWNADDRNLTFYEDTTNYSNVAKYVWESDDRNLTFYQVSNLSVDDIWNYYNRSLTFYEDTTNYSKVAEYVWLYVDRNLTTEYINNISADEIWNYYNRSLTQDIPFEVWSYQNRNLTEDIPFEVWSYQNRTLTYYTLNLSDLINQINDYEFIQDSITFGGTNDSVGSNELNVVLYIVK